MEEKELVRIATVNDKIQADMMVNLLMEEGINAFKQPISCVDYMDSYIGYGTAGEDIVVQKKDAVRAKELVNEILYPDGDYTRISGRTNLVRILAILILAVFVISTAANILPQIIDLIR